MQDFFKINKLTQIINYIVLYNYTIFKQKNSRLFKLLKVENYE